MFSKLGSNKATTDRFRTNRERQTSASRLRLKNSKRTSKRHAVSSTVPEKSKRGPNWRTKGDPLGFFKIHSVAKYQKKMKGRTFGNNKKFSKKSHSADEN